MILSLGLVVERVRSNLALMVEGVVRLKEESFREVTENVGRWGR